MATVYEFAPSSTSENSRDRDPGDRFMELRRAERIPEAINYINQAIATFEFGVRKQNEYGEWYELQPQAGDVLSSEVVGNYVVHHDKVSAKVLQYLLGHSKDSYGATTLGQRGTETMRAIDVSCDLETLETTTAPIEGRNLRYVVSDFRAQTHRKEWEKKYNTWRQEVLAEKERQEAELLAEAKRIAEMAEEQIERAAAD